MATPLKPWEKVGASRTPPQASSLSPKSGTRDQSSTGQPAIPPRPASVPSGEYGDNNVIF